VGSKADAFCHKVHFIIASLFTSRRAFCLRSNYGPVIGPETAGGVPIPADADEMSVGSRPSRRGCLALIDDAVRGKTRRVVLMKHNRPVAAIVPTERTRRGFWGALRGTVKIAPGTDLTQGTGEVWEADT
jgi:antitoxin (DNA-binding transcriptional repressor) of toxin-antitoxin stability system